MQCLTLLADRGRMEAVLLLGSGEVARALELSREHLRRLVLCGQIRPAARTAHYVLFDPEEVERVRLARLSRKNARPGGTKPRAPHPEPAAAGSRTKTTEEGPSGVYR